MMCVCQIFDLVRAIVVDIWSSNDSTYLRASHLLRFILILYVLVITELRDLAKTHNLVIT
jgi:hypothetical protein